MIHSARFLTSKISGHLRRAKKMSTIIENIKFYTLTNDEYKKLPSVEVIYGTASTQFGHCLIGLYENKICYISLFDEGKENSAIDNLQSDWPNAKLKADDSAIEKLTKEIFTKNKRPKLEVMLRGTDLQCGVWMELVKVKEGSTASYESIAKSLGKPKAVRAIANAIAKNRIAYVVPCHRVIRKTGAPNKYRWGPQRKVDILKCESEL